jgi:hypothetical protein
MDLGARQTRGLYLPGTVPFPTPYPSTGPISFDVGHLSYSAIEPPRDKDLVVSQEHRGNQTIVRVMLQEHVSAVFIPGARNVDGVFRPSDKAQVDNFDEGEWFLGSDVNADVVRRRLKLGVQADISSRGSKLRGIVFIATERPVLRIMESTGTAGSEYPSAVRGCSPCMQPQIMPPMFAVAPCTRCNVRMMFIPEFPQPGGDPSFPFTPFTCTRWCISGGFGIPEPIGWPEPWSVPVCTQCMVPHGGVPGEECRCTCCRCTCCRCTCCREPY